MATTKAQQKAVDKYVKANYDRIEFKAPKGRKAEIKAHAEAYGESVNSFIGRAIKETMERVKQGTNVPCAFLFSFAVSSQTFAVLPLLFSLCFWSCVPVCFVPVVISMPVLSNTESPNVQNPTPSCRHCTHNQCSKVFHHMVQSWWDSNRCSDQPGTGDHTSPAPVQASRIPSVLS